MCIRCPAAISNRSTIASRWRNVYQSIDTAPRSSADVPSQIRCEWMRLSSRKSVRRYFARGGISIPSSRSTAPQNASMLKK